MRFLIRLIVMTLAVIITSYILPGINLEDFWTALIVAIVLGLLNAFLRPLLIILTIPVTILTFGLFLLVINALLILLASRLVPGFQVDGFWWALAFSVIVTLISSLFQGFERRHEEQ
ncbi:MAG: phage holin family protein [Bacteroidetes bacterium]|nr:phage holin family protein [Bacteroidota bacterium]